MSVGMKQILEIIQGPVICMLNEEQHTFENNNDVVTFLTDRGGVQAYRVISISVKNGNIALSLSEPSKKRNDQNASWFKENIKVYGTEPSIFDGV